MTKIHDSGVAALTRLDREGPDGSKSKGGTKIGMHREPGVPTQEEVDAGAPLVLPHPVPEQELDHLLDWLDAGGAMARVAPGYTTCAMHMGRLYARVVDLIGEKELFTPMETRMIARAVVRNGPRSTTRERTMLHRLQAANEAQNRELKTRRENLLIGTLLDRVRIFFGQTYFDRFAQGFEEAVQATLGADFAAINGELKEIFDDLAEFHDGKSLREQVEIFQYDDEAQDILEGVLDRIVKAAENPGFRTRIQGAEGLPPTFLDDLMPILQSTRPSQRLAEESHTEIPPGERREKKPLPHQNPVCQGNFLAIKENLHTVLTAPELQELKCNRRPVRKAIIDAFLYAFDETHWQAINLNRQEAFFQSFELERKANDLLSIVLNFQLQPLFEKPDPHFYTGLEGVLEFLLGKGYLNKQNLLLAPIRNDYYTREVNQTDWNGFLNNPSVQERRLEWLRRLQTRLVKGYPKASQGYLEMAGQLGREVRSYARDAAINGNGVLTGEVIFYIMLVDGFQKAGGVHLPLPRRGIFEALFTPLIEEELRKEEEARRREEEEQAVAEEEVLPGPPPTSEQTTLLAAPEEATAPGTDTDPPTLTLRHYAKTLPTEEPETKPETTKNAGKSKKRRRKKKN